MEKAKGVLNKLGLALHENKTRVVNLDKDESFDFLGFTFRYCLNRRVKVNPKKTVFYYPSKKSMKSIRAKLKEVISVSQHYDLTWLCKEKLKIQNVPMHVVGENQEDMTARLALGPLQRGLDE